MSLLLVLVVSSPVWLTGLAFATGAATTGPHGDGVFAGSLPPDRFEELRRPTLADARQIMGPRLENPRLSGGLGPGIAGILAEQRAYLHLQMLKTFPGTSMISSHQASSSHPKSTVDARSNSLDPHGRPPLTSLCSGPAIRSVNGRSISPVFTPAEPDNHFRIEGCSFGSRPGIVLLRPTRMSSNPDPILLTLDTPASWTENSISVHLDPGLRGLLDSPVDLVVRLGSGRTTQLGGCMFIASRGKPQLLKTIPAEWVTLDPTSTPTRAIRQLEFESPPLAGDEIPSRVAGASAYIVRSDQDSFRSGKDIFDFSQLTPGWAVESVQLTAFIALCPSQAATHQNSADWSTSWNPRGFAISWISQTCVSFIAPVFKFTLHSSQYAARVWVTGPAGTQPLRTTFKVLHQ